MAVLLSEWLKQRFFWRFIHVLFWKLYIEREREKNESWRWSIKFWALGVILNYSVFVNVNWRLITIFENLLPRYSRVSCGFYCTHTYVAMLYSKRVVTSLYILRDSFSNPSNDIPIPIQAPNAYVAWIISTSSLWTTTYLTILKTILCIEIYTCYWIITRIALPTE